MRGWQAWRLWEEARLGLVDAVLWVSSGLPVTAVYQAISSGRLIGICGNECRPGLAKIVASFGYQVCIMSRYRWSGQISVN